MDNGYTKVTTKELTDLMRDSVRYNIVCDYIKHSDKQYFDRDILTLLLGIDEEEKETDHE